MPRIAVTRVTFGGYALRGWPPAARRLSCVDLVRSRRMDEIPVYDACTRGIRTESWVTPAIEAAGTPIQRIADRTLSGLNQPR
jgi:hypothetical protein